MKGTPLPKASLAVLCASRGTWNGEGWVTDRVELGIRRWASSLLLAFRIDAKFGLYIALVGPHQRWRRQLARNEQR
jgi:hypothetical protein